MQLHIRYHFSVILAGGWIYGKILIGTLSLGTLIRNINSGDLWLIYPRDKISP